MARGGDPPGGRMAWQEKWRFRRLWPTEWAPRRRALDEVHEVPALSSVRPELAGDDRSWAMRRGFPEIDEAVVRQARWKTVYAGPFRLHERSGLKDGRAFLCGVFHLAPRSENHAT